MIDVFEFIKEKKADFKENTERYRVMLEPKFKALSEKLNSKITNTLNNPWMFNLPSIDRSKIFKKKPNINNEKIKNAYEKIVESIGKEILVGPWETIDQERINRFADVTGDRQWIHTDLTKAKLESPFNTTIAHGFLTLKKENIICYSCTEYRSPIDERSLKFNDPKIKIKWPVKKPNLSIKDKNAQSFDSLFK